MNQQKQALQESKKIDVRLYSRSRCSRSRLSNFSTLKLNVQNIQKCGSNFPRSNFQKCVKIKNLQMSTKFLNFKYRRAYSKNSTKIFEIFGFTIKFLKYPENGHIHFGHFGNIVGNFGEMKILDSVQEKLKKNHN